MSIEKELEKLKKKKQLYGPATKPIARLLQGSIGNPTENIGGVVKAKVNIAAHANQLMSEIRPVLDSFSDDVYNAMSPLVQGFNMSFKNGTPTLDELHKHASDALVELKKLDQNKETKSVVKVITSWISSWNPFAASEKKPEKKPAQIEPPKDEIKIAPTAVTIPPRAVAINKNKGTEASQIEAAITSLVKYEKPANDEMVIYEPSVYANIFNYLRSINYGEKAQSAAMFIAEKINQVREADRKMKETPVTIREMNNILGVNLTPLNEYEDELITTDIALPGSTIEPTYQRKNPVRVLEERPLKLLDERPANYKQLPMYSQLFNKDGIRYSDVASINERILNQLHRDAPDFMVINKDIELNRQIYNPFKSEYTLQHPVPLNDLPPNRYEDVFYEQPWYSQGIIGLPRNPPAEYFEKNQGQSPAN